MSLSEMPSPSMGTPETLNEIEVGFGDIRGIGLDGSWGQMIDGARDELSRDPIVWWNIGAAGSALFGLILAVNAVGDAVRDVLDPRTLRETQ